MRFINQFIIIIIINIIYVAKVISNWHSCCSEKRLFKNLQLAAIYANEFFLFSYYFLNFRVKAHFTKYWSNTRCLYLFSTRLPKQNYPVSRKRFDKRARGPTIERLIWRGAKMWYDNCFRVAIDLYITAVNKKQKTGHHRMCTPSVTNRQNTHVGNRIFKGGKPSKIMSMIDWWEHPFTRCRHRHL